MAGVCERIDLSWDCVTSRDQLKPEIVDRRDRLVNAARDGHWQDVLALVDDRDFFFSDAITVNSSRVGGRSGFALLHQAAYRGDRGAAGELVARGAWLTLRAEAGETGIRFTLRVQSVR